MRRTSESFIPLPPSRKGAKDQQAFDLDLTGERREQNTLINDIRREVERRRAGDWNGVTPYTRKLLAHWAATPPARDEPAFSCQREAAETAIFLAEIAGRHGAVNYRRRLEPENALHNDGLPRVGLKMATGTGKTVVMGMLIARQTVNLGPPQAPRFQRPARPHAAPELRRSLHARPDGSPAHAIYQVTPKVLWAATGDTAKAGQTPGRQSQRESARRRPRAKPTGRTSPIRPAASH